MSGRRSRQPRTRLPRRSRRTHRQHRRAADQQIQNVVANQAKVIRSVVMLLQKLKAQIEPATTGFDEGRAATFFKALMPATK